MGTIAARHARDIVANARNVLAIEAFCAAQAAEYRGINKMASRTKERLESIRKVAGPIDEDRVFSPDIERISSVLLAEAQYGIESKVMN